MPVQTRSQTRSQTKMLQEAQQLNKNITIREKTTRKKNISRIIENEDRRIINMFNFRQFSRQTLIPKIKTTVALKPNNYFKTKADYFDTLRLITEIHYMLNTYHTECYTEPIFARVYQLLYDKAKQHLNSLNNHRCQPTTTEEHQIVQSLKEELHTTIKVLDKHVKKEPFYELPLSKTHKKFIYDDMEYDI
jgi:hypothetical protein